jgi:hypothetical protein
MIKPRPKSAISWLHNNSCTAILAVLICITPCHAQGDIAAEYKLKAALLFKLNRFVEWPLEPANKSKSTFSICILGDNAFGDILEPLRKRLIKDRPVEINYYALSNQIVKSDCHMLFIHKSKRAFIADILKSINNRPILTVSDINNFADKGGMIEFAQGEKNIGFTINLESARLAELSISAPLLQISNVIGGTR